MQTLNIYSFEFGIKCHLNVFSKESHVFGFSSERLQGNLTETIFAVKAASESDIVCRLGCLRLMWRHKVCFSVTQSFGISTFVHWHSNQPWRKLKNEEHIVEACSFYKIFNFFFFISVVKCIALGLWLVLNELNVTFSFMSAHNWALFPLLMSVEAYNVPSCVCLFFGSVVVMMSVSFQWFIQWKAGVIHQDVSLHSVPCLKEWTSVSFEKL